MIIYLGNAAVHPDINVDPDNPDAVKPEPPAESVTVIHPSPNSTPVDLMTEVASLWRAHSVEPPSWIACDDDAIASLLSAQFDRCPVRTIKKADAAYAAAASEGK